MKANLLLSQKEIALRSGLSPQMISDILKGDRTASLETSMKLEKVTGVCREAWLLPESHWNPYVHGGDPERCMYCPNRFSRAELLTAQGVEYVRQNPTRKGVKDLLESVIQFIGIPKDRITIRLGVFAGPILCTLGYAGRKAKGITDDVMYAKDVPKLVQRAMSKGMVVIPYISEMLIDAPKEWELTEKYDIKSFYMVLSEHMAMAIIFYNKPAILTLEMMERYRGALGELEVPLKALIEECQEYASNL